MEALSATEFHEKAEKAYRAVFANEDPYGEPFQPRVHPRLLLYGFRYGLQEPWLDPIVSAIKTLGEDGFYLSLLRKTGREPWHWYVPLSEAGLYISEIFPVENTIYSQRGTWGIICSEEDHALVAGPETLIESIKGAVSDLHERELWFLDTWKYYREKNKVDIQWIPDLLSHIYGIKKARELLGEAQMEWLMSDSEK